MPAHSRACVPQNEKPPQGEVHALQLEGSLCLLQLRKDCEQQWRPNVAKTRYINQFFPVLFICLLYNIVLVLPYLDMNPPRVYMCSPSSLSSLPIPSIPLGHPSAPSILYHASNLDWQFVSHMIIYMFQCHSPKSSRLCPLPQSPKDCSMHLCLFCYLAYGVIITIFLNSIYMC